MQKNILIATFVTLVVALVAVFVLIFEFSGASEVFNVFKQESTENSVIVRKSNGWADKLASVNSKDYYLPVNDLFIKIDLKINKKSEKSFYTSYNLIIQDHDRYSLFCIKQVLDLFALPYIMVSEKNRHNIIIQSQNKKSLTPITKELLKYNINSKIEEVIHEKNSNM